MELWPLPLKKRAPAPESFQCTGFLVLRPCGSQAMEVFLRFLGYFCGYGNG